MGLSDLAFWTIRSRWDYFAFPALAFWALVAAAEVALQAHEPTGTGLVIAAGFMNMLSALTVLASALGSRAHDHMDPGLPYYALSLFLGAAAGVHYLWRTGRA